MHNRGTKLVILLLGDPLRLEGGEGCKDRTPNPGGILRLRPSNDIDLHGGRTKSPHLFLHAVSDAMKHGTAAGQYYVGVQLLPGGWYILRQLSHKRISSGTSTTLALWYVYRELKFPRKMSAISRLQKCLAINHLQKCLAISHFQKCNRNSVMAVTRVMWHWAGSGNGNQPNWKVAIRQIKRWQSTEFKDGNQLNSKVAISRIQSCNKSSIVAVTPEMNINFGDSCHKQNKFWCILLQTKQIFCASCRTFHD